MKTKIGTPILLILIVVAAYVGYRKGYSDATVNATANRAAEFVDDSNSDPSAQHSPAYSLGYTRGHAFGSVETRQKDFTECGENLAKLAVEAGNAKIAGKWLADGYFAPSQLEAAETQVSHRR